MSEQTKRELRALPQHLELRSDDGKPAVITGYAAKFNELSEELYGFREQIAPGAFAKTIAADDIRALWNHDSSLVLGRTKSKTLQLSEDETGLRFELELPNTQLGKDAYETIRRGDVDGMSFMFVCTQPSNWEEVNGETIRTLTEVQLFEVSPTTFPAYPSSTVAVRSMADILAERPAAPPVDSPAGSDDEAAQLRRRQLLAALLSE